jgi:UDP-N-acetylglucosamine 2-epimerase (non-hydrolysing)/GDP/UDP-N,N'-diacetylbacillosamine 2-epimerase (hydrolysing)
MGEEPWRVHTVGFPAIDLISEGCYAQGAEVFERLGLNPEQPVVLFTQHSVATEFDHSVDQLKPSLDAIEALAAEGVQVILTYPNNDAGGRQIIERLEAFRERAFPNTQVHRSLGRHLYHGVLALAQNPELRIACVGNSSSGLKETPAFGCPTVNIGSRQEGRLRGENVLEADYSTAAITKAVKRCLFDDEFRGLCRRAENPYWLGDAGPKIAQVLAEIELDQNLIRKRMTLKGEVQDGWFR